MWVDNLNDLDLYSLLKYIKINFLPLPSNNQYVEAGVKDAALCRRSGRSERIASLLNFFHSTITSYVIEEAKSTAIINPKKERGKKRKRDTDEKNGGAIWVCESLKVEAIIKRAKKFDPYCYSLERYQMMQSKLGVDCHFSANRIINSKSKFVSGMNKDKRKNIAQLKVGVDTTPFLLGKIQYGKLKSIHIPLVKQEIVFRTQQQIIDDKLGICALTLLLRGNEMERTGKDVKFFEPLSKPVEDWGIN